MNVVLIYNWKYGDKRVKSKIPNNQNNSFWIVFYPNDIWYLLISSLKYEPKTHNGLGSGWRTIEGYTNRSMVILRFLVFQIPLCLGIKKSNFRERKVLYDFKISANHININISINFWDDECPFYMKKFKLFRRPRICWQGVLIIRIMQTEIASTLMVFIITSIFK